MADFGQARLTRNWDFIHSNLRPGQTSWTSIEAFLACLLRLLIRIHGPGVTEDRFGVGVGLGRGVGSVNSFYRCLVKLLLRIWCDLIVSFILMEDLNTYVKFIYIFGGMASVDHVGQTLSFRRTRLAGP